MTLLFCVPSTSFNYFLFFFFSLLKGGLTMRGIHKKGKNGPGLTGIQRVLNTRERVQEVEDPCKVGGL